ncbi:LuxR C-terminal-related transcriptional regulator [Actinoplanes sp. NPDC051411]|uniref:helix-turn-helix transcriptional regulator n=1 Tax=Actinoplanes sp. NPDC051411 TaxID=3155522 RepID=UPI003430FF40
MTAARGDGGAVVVLGERGSGRTSMAAQATAAASGFAVLSSGGSPGEADLPGACLHRLLRPARDAFAELAPHHAEALRRVTEGRPGEPLTLPAALLELLCRLSPALCVIDDADLADAVSLRALAFAARRLEGSRIAMVLAVRSPAELLAGLPAVTLGPLGREDARALLDDLPGPRLPGDVAGALIAVADGNPLALRELVAGLDARQRRGEAPPPDSLPPDSRLRRAFRAALDRLPAPARRMVVCAAADPELPVEEPAAFEPAERAGLLRVAGERLVFRPAVLRRVAYREATVAERREAHRLLAAVVADPLRRDLHTASLTAGTDDALAGRLARHADHAAPAAAAGALEAAARVATDPAPYRIAAARQAFRAGEPWRARLLLRQTAASAESEILAGELDLRIDGRPAARRLVAAAAELVERDRRHALDALVAAADAMGRTGDYQGFPTLARQAEALRHPGDPPVMALLTDYLTGSAAIYRGDYRGAAGPLRRVRTAAVRLDEHPALIRACAAAFLLGHDAAARSLGDRATALARESGDVSSVPLAMEFAAGARFALGRHDEAVSDLQESADMARESGQCGLAGGNLALLAVLAAVHGDPATARLRVREAVASPGSRGRALGDWALATVDLLAGRHREAVARLVPLMATGHLIVRIAATPFAVEAAVRAGETVFAKELTETFDRWAPHTGNPDWLALSARCHALVTGDDEHFVRAIDAHAQGSSEFERARTELLYGSQLRRKRRPIRAREHLRSALDAFERLECSWWAAHVAGELRAAGEPPVRPRERRALTPQQTRIAELVASGATNREVAAKLFLSPRTVDHHLRNIFTRLGIRSRVDLVRLMT